MNIEVECGLLMAIGDGKGEEGMSVYFHYCRRRRRYRRRHVVSGETGGRKARGING